MKKMTIATLAILASMTSVAFAGENAAPKTCTATFNQEGTVDGGAGAATEQQSDSQSGVAEDAVPPKQ